ncbi:unnamed protein product [Didymodactylos carnosus]|uniref:Uncharacterized protein n=1 Tax=Didymodactylos carnosus TaxID=1234261 RepID=A0A814YL49_9BILA|nr:unnamed protein product [Didymodactylos carnosus]CAF1231867.1 unnamed protein product [Didymodactylos carnosus]CAF3517616.1 unnamed protein product [Didymodactylos carnosus]CAF3994510.1 unnamed protein product [Didymodactylos carnosus]
MDMLCLISPTEGGDNEECIIHETPSFPYCLTRNLILIQWMLTILICASEIGNFIHGFIWLGVGIWMTLPAIVAVALTTIFSFGRNRQTKYWLKLSWIASRLSLLFLCVKIGCDIFVLLKHRDPISNYDFNQLSSATSSLWRTRVIDRLTLSIFLTLSQFVYLLLYCCRFRYLYKNEPITAIVN